MPDPAALTGSTDGPLEAPVHERTGQLPVAALTCLAGAVAASGAYLLILQSHLTFFADDWEFLIDRRGFSVGVFLDPHNDHIAVAPVAIYKALLALFGMSSALPFQIVSTLVFLLSAVLLFVYLRRRVGVWLALLGSVLILFIGAAWTDLLWSFQIGFSGSIAAGIGALLALERDDRKGDAIACTLLVISNSFSETGVPFAVGAFVSVALGPSPRLQRLYVVLVPLVLYGAWYVGWGHKGLHSASFHNLVNSPKFVFDSVSVNIVSTLGLATPFSDKANGMVGGVNSGRILLVVAIGLAAWWQWRVGPPSRWLWAVLAAGAAFWFLTALNAIPRFRTPTIARYQYPGAIFLLLIAAELVRGVRPGKRLLTAAAAVTVAAAISGVIFLHDAYSSRKAASDNLRARLAAVEIGRGRESPDLEVVLHILYARPASSYFSAVDAFGSPAFSESGLAASDETDRVAADQLLASAEGVKLSRGARGAGERAGCQTATVLGPGSALKLGPGKYTLRARRPAGSTVQLARFADEASVDLTALEPGAAAALTIPHDRSSRPWRLYSLGPSAMAACTLTQP